MFRALSGPTARWAGLLGVPVGGGPPASRPRRELRSARRLEARPGPATAHGHRSQALPPPTGTAARPSGPSGALHTGNTLHTGGASIHILYVHSAPCPDLVPLRLARPRVT